MPDFSVKIVEFPVQCDLLFLCGKKIFCRIFRKQSQKRMFTFKQSFQRKYSIFSFFVIFWGGGMDWEETFKSFLWSLFVQIYEIQPAKLNFFCTLSVFNFLKMSFAILLFFFSLRRNGGFLSFLGETNTEKRKKRKR